MITDLDIEKLKKIFAQKVERATQIVTSITSWNNISGKPTTFPPTLPADPNADKYLMWDDSEGVLVWAEGSGAFNNLSATTDPTTSNDNTQGYSVGSFWINVSLDRIYQCVDASTGAAIWGRLNSVIVDDAPSDGQTYGRKNGNWFTITSGAEPTLILSLGINDWLGLYAIDFGTSTIIIPG